MVLSRNNRLRTAEVLSCFLVIRHSTAVDDDCSLLPIIEGDPALYYPLFISGRRLTELFIIVWHGIGPWEPFSPKNMSKQLFIWKPIFTSSQVA
jgi:hypothetical protein